MSDVHNHPPYRPVCNERVVDGQLLGACMPDPEPEHTARPAHPDTMIGRK